MKRGEDKKNERKKKEKRKRKKQRDTRGREKEGECHVIAHDRENQSRQGQGQDQTRIIIVVRARVSVSTRVRACRSVSSLSLCVRVWGRLVGGVYSYWPRLTTLELPCPARLSVRPALGSLGSYSYMQQHPLEGGQMPMSDLHICTDRYSYRVLPPLSPPLPSPSFPLAELRPNEKPGRGNPPVPLPVRVSSWYKYNRPWTVQVSRGTRCALGPPGLCGLAPTPAPASCRRWACQISSKRFLFCFLTWASSAGSAKPRVGKGGRTDRRLVTCTSVEKVLALKV